MHWGFTFAELYRSGEVNDETTHFDHAVFFLDLTLAGLRGNGIMGI